MNDDPLIRLEDDPYTDEVHQPFTAFNQGFDAAEQQIPMSLNPYQGTEWEHAWECGYSEALDEDR